MADSTQSSINPQEASFIAGAPGPIAPPVTKTAPPATQKKAPIPQSSPTAGNFSDYYNKVLQNPTATPDAKKEALLYTNPTEYAKQYGAQPVSGPIDTSTQQPGQTQVNTTPAPVPATLAPSVDAIHSTSTSITDFLSTLKDSLEQQKKTLQDSNKSIIDQYIKEGNYSQAQELQTQQLQYNVPTQYKALLDIQPDITNLTEQLASLKAAQANEEAAVQGQGGVPQGIVMGQLDSVGRKYAAKIAGVSAELGAKTAIASMYQGNIDTANKMIDQTVNAMTYDVTQRKNDLAYFVQRNDQYINTLDSQTKSVIDQTMNQLQIEEKNQRDDYYFKLGLIQDAAAKYVNLGLSVPDLQKMSTEDVLSTYDQKMGSSSPNKVSYEDINGMKTMVVTDRGGNVVQAVPLGVATSPVKLGGGSGNFTQDQLNKGSARANAAGISPTDFANLPAEIKDQFINNYGSVSSATGFSSDLNVINTAAKDPSSNLSTINDTIDGLGYTDTVTQYLKDHAQQVYDANHTADTTTPGPSVLQKIGGFFQGLTKPGTGKSASK